MSEAVNLSVRRADLSIRPYNIRQKNKPSDFRQEGLFLGGANSELLNPSPIGENTSPYKIPIRRTPMYALLTPNLFKAPLNLTYNSRGQTPDPPIRRSSHQANAFAPAKLKLSKLFLTHFESQPLK